MKNRGFTLVELLVVIAIIGLLSSIVLVSLAGTRAKARDAVRMADLRQIQKILETYEINQNKYPFSTQDYQIQDHPWGSFWENYGTVPRDPLKSQSYAYYSDSMSFQLYAKFEKTPVYPAFACGVPCGPDGQYNGGLASSNSVLTAFETTPPLGEGGEGGVPPGGFPGGEGGEEIVCDPPVASGERTFSVTTKENPKITQVVINPFNVNKYAWQEVKTSIRETEGQPITEVVGEVRTNEMSFPFSLSLIEGTDIDGTWQGLWYNEDEYCQNYMLIITATSESGQSKVELAFR